MAFPFEKNVKYRSACGDDDDKVEGVAEWTRSGVLWKGRDGDSWHWLQEKQVGAAESKQ